MKNKNPKDGELWLVKLSEHINSVVTICDDQFLHGEFYKSHSCTDVSDENLIERLYTQRQADAYAKKCVDHDRKRFAHEKCVQCGYSLKQAEALVKQMNDKQETVLATEMSERDIPDFEGMAGIFDACASNKPDDESKVVKYKPVTPLGAGADKERSDDTESDYNKGMRDCVKAIASQIGLTFGVDVGYADLPYKLATHIADLKIGNAVDAVAGEWDGKGIPPVGVECNFTPDNTRWGFNYIESFTGTVLHYEGEQFVFMLKHKQYNIKDEAIVVSRTDKGEFSKCQSPQEKAKREREEAINMMVDDFLSCDVESLLGIDGKVAKVCLALYDAGYRKGE